MLTSRKERKTLLSKNKKYQRITRLIIFSIVKIKPDITFAILLVSRFAKNPSY